MADSNDTATAEKVEVHLSEVGRSGTLVVSNIIDADYLSQLNGVDGQKQFEKMIRSDSQIRKVYNAVNNPIRSAKWDIEPASEDEADLKVAALIKHILFNDIPLGWKGKLNEILKYPWHGHAVFEVVHQNRIDKKLGPYTGLKNLAFRDQRTLLEWEHDSSGVLLSIRQVQQGDIAVDVKIPAQNLMIFYNEKTGNDNGFAFCRMLYGNYERKLLYKQLQAIGIERSAIPVPELKLPKDLKPTSDDYKLAEAQLEAFTLAENAYFMVPDGFELKINNTNAFDPSRVQTAIKAENEEIVGALVAMFLEMGIGGNSGNQAGTEVSATFFKNQLEYLADTIADQINIELIPNLVRLNFGDTVEVMPKLVHSGITETDGEKVMKIVTGYVEKGVITTDEQLEDWARKQNNLPKKAEGAMIDNQKAEPTKPKDPKDTPPVDPAKSTDKNLSEKSNTIDFANAKPLVVPNMIAKQGARTTDIIRNAAKFTGQKYIVDVMNRYKQLPESKKQSATDKITVGGKTQFKKALKAIFSETMSLAIEQAKKEVPTDKVIKLSSKSADFEKVAALFPDYADEQINELSKFPAHIQLLIAKQAELISEDVTTELIAALNFNFSGNELKTISADIIQQNMEETLAGYLENNTLTIKGDNISAMLVNEGRETYFQNDDVFEMIHSYTFMNADPKSPVCRALAGITFNTNDFESLRYSPPLHHGCKSYLRANLKTSKGVDGLKISTLSPTAEQIKSITL